MQFDWFPLVHDLTIRLVQAPSVTHTADESNFAEYLHRLLAAHPYFHTHPAQVWTEPLPDDPYHRRNVWALVRGRGSATVVLSGHYDVVSVDNYADLASVACDPSGLLPRLIADLAEHATSEADRLALDDLRSGLYLPGRGALDMKSGIAAGIAVLQRFAELKDRVGNLLLVATPDEEAMSEGMRGAACRLPDIAREHGLALVAAINLDAMADRGNGSDGQAVFLGSVGKLLPSVYLVGREAHAGYPFDGINPNRLAAEVTRRLDSNTALCDAAAGEWTPPPVTLKQTDAKQGYDVTIPAAAWCTYNVLSYARGPAAVFEMVRHEVAAAVRDVLEEQQAQARHFHLMTGYRVTSPGLPLVLTFDELHQRVRGQCGLDSSDLIQHLSPDLARDTTLDLPEWSRRVTELLWQHSGLHGPAVVIGFAALYYPCVHLDPTQPGHVKLREVVERQVRGVETDAGVRVRVRPFFPAISDMSFLGGNDSAADLAVMAQNSPGWGSRIRFDYAAAQELHLPMINIGPWGRDYHQRTERVYMPYAFGVVPELIWRVVADLVTS
jgi:arginine utilization protein RocB